MPHPDKRELLNGSRVFCMLPWVSLNIHPTGKVFPCCLHAYGLPPLGNLRESRLEQIWNSGEMKRIRRNMLEGKESPQCARCYELERTHFVSLRMESNERFSRHFPEVEATKEGGEVEGFRLAYLDVRFSNVCNFKCRYCNIGLSSSWHPDHAVLWGPPHHEAVQTPTQDPEDLWRQIKPLLPGVEMIYFSGGEPLLAPEHHKTLAELVRNDRFDVRLLYSTNFSLLDAHGADVLGIWKRFQHVHIAASLDGMGKRGEYIRKNQNWEQVVKNRERMLQVCPKASFSIAPTLSVMNVFHLPDFHWDWLEKGYIGLEDIFINFLFEPEEFSVQVLPQHMKKRVVETYERHIERVLTKYGSRAERVERHFRAALNFMTACDRTDLLGRFRQKTDKMDRLRGERFQDIFPELAELMDDPKTASQASCVA